METVRGKSPALGAVTFLVCVFLYAPIAVLVAFSFNRSRLSARWLGFTAEWYRSLWHNEQIFNSLANSLAVAILATLISVVFGTLTALALSRGRVRGRALLDGLIYLPLVIPEIVVAVALVIFFSLMRFQLSLWTIVIAHVTFCISYVIIVVGARLASTDRIMFLRWLPPALGSVPGIELVYFVASTAESLRPRRNSPRSASLVPLV